ncbi:unnamed protein product [Adineta steineri]|uniref:Uncharacterized protein n=1 Tax=Adineta steineri TaxID=433720 RepID=A0A820A1L8_9BILA|nr:unnamed protein product [Adineta steineri]CAF1105245.1 unnamed protein product [Adineta steineri]CAF4183226.1 unnamed protein product [Adineta steineri]
MGTTGDFTFSVGEQSEESRKKFWISNYKKCPMCNSENIAVNWWVCACRHNGDGSGTVVYQCLGNETRNDVEKVTWDKTKRKLSGEHGCGFYTSFLYDEAASGDENYETHYWKK